MRRAEKIRLANASLNPTGEPDSRDKAAREAGRQEWALVRKAAREAFLAQGDWMRILNEYREREGFYTAAERARMCSLYADELITHASR
jgi:hypothetical protein